MSDVNGRILKECNDTAIKSETRNNSAEKNRNYYNSTPNKSMISNNSEKRLRFDISTRKEPIPEAEEE